MKIGLLTYHISTNIGAMMQTYATCKAMRQLGHDVVIVDIRQPESKHSGLIKYITNMMFVKQAREHQKFRKEYYPPLTRHYNTVEELRKEPPMVDCLVVGSDQTWNPAISKEVSMAYFLDFGADSIRRFSYASSFGMDQWDKSKELTESVNLALHRMQSISVREKTAIKICKETFGKEAELVVDPTLLFDGYPEITGPIKEREELLCYKLRRNDDFYRNIGILKKNIGLPARLLNNVFPVKGLKYMYPPSVKEWIMRIGGAKFVVTDSFHGVAFSLLYKRQFAVIRNHNGRDSRFEDLLAAVGLEDRIFDSVAQLSQTDSWKKEIDYNEVTPKLERLRSASWDYLKKALS